MAETLEVLKAKYETSTTTERYVKALQDSREAALEKRDRWKVRALKAEDEREWVKEVADKLEALLLAKENSDD